MALGDPILYDTILHHSIVCENVKVVVYFRLILRWPNATHFHWPKEVFVRGYWEGAPPKQKKNPLNFILKGPWAVVFVWSGRVC